MLTNPYQNLLDTSTGLRVQLDINGQDKGDLMSLRPVRGTTQLILSRLIHNLCNELRDLNIIGYRADADTILSILTERRPLDPNQLHRLEQTSVGRTIASPTAEVPTGVLDNSGGTGVCEGTPSTPVEPNHTPSQVTGGKQRDRKTKSKKTEGEQSES